MPPRIPTIAALFVLLATPLAVLAETLDEVEAKIAEAYAKHKTIAARMKFTTDVKTDGFALKSEGESPKSDAKSAEKKESADAAPEQKPEPKKTEKKKGLGGLIDKVVK